MSSTATETFTPEHVTLQTGSLESIRPEPMQGTHFERMGGFYAWVVVTLAIFMLAGMLAGIERGQGTADLGDHPGDTVSAAHVRTL